LESEYQPVLASIGAREPPMFIMGGFAEEALLHGRATRRHDDVDVLVVRRDLMEYDRFFQTLGFRDYRVYLLDPYRRPTVLNCRANGISLELCIGDLDEYGSFHFDIYGEPNDTHYRIYLPDDTFTCPAAQVDGVTIQTVSPLALYQLRAGLGITQSFGPFRPKDVKAQRELKEHFFAGQSEEELRPRIQKIEPRS
jgi:hypothetical protein